MCKAATAILLRKPGGRRTASFTLVELLVVIMIVGTLAAVAVPQFGDSSRDAKLAALDRDLAALRGAVERYKLEHGGQPPGRVATHRIGGGSGGGVGGSITVIIGHTDRVDAFTKQLSFYSNARGDTSTEKTAAYPCGPYLRSGIPDSPVAEGKAAAAPAVVSVVADTTPLRPDATPATGWKASYETGEVIVNHAEHWNR